MELATATYVQSAIFIGSQIFKNHFDSAFFYLWVIRARYISSAANLILYVSRLLVAKLLVK